jgi:hypothetical protein
MFYLLQGACCLRGACTEVLPANCPKTAEVDLANGCATTVTTCGNSTRGDTGELAVEKCRRQGEQFNEKSTFQKL